MVRTKVTKKPRRSNKPPDNDDEDEFEPPAHTPPQSGLVPIPGTPFYATPSEPASPFDCDRYPESLYCGENPFTQTPIGLEPSIVIDECNLGIQLTPTLGFVILPSLQVVYRRNTEECRPKPPPTPIPDTVPPDFVFPNRPSDPNTMFVAVMYGSKLVGRTEYNSYNYGYAAPYNGECPAGTHTVNRKIIINELEFPYEKPNIGVDPVLRRLYARVKLTLTSSRTGTEVFNCHNASQYIDSSESRTIEIVTSTDQFIDHSLIPQSLDSIWVGLIVIGNYDYIKQIYDNGSHLTGGGQTTDYKENWRNFSYVDARENYVFYETTEFNILTRTNTPKPVPEPPPPKLPKRCDCNMTCCPSTTQNDQLLRSLIQKVDKLSKIVGVDDYPVSLPTSLISRDEGFLGNLIPNFNEDVPSLTRFLAWYVKRFDEICGQWEIPIEVKDSDPTKPGDQPVGFKLPNVAEAIAEMFGLLLQSAINSETLVNINTRALIEEGQIKQQTFKTYMMAQAIADHLGFEYKETKHKIPMLFKIGEQELDKLLVEGELEVTAPEYTDPNDLKTSLNDLLQAAAIIRAVHFRKFDPNQDIKQQFKDLIGNLVAGGDRINKQETDPSGKDDFDRFLEDVETGFTQTPGATDPTHPYGRDYDQRPKVKEIGTDTSDSNNGT